MQCQSWVIKGEAEDTRSGVEASGTKNTASCRLRLGSEAFPRQSSSPVSHGAREAGSQAVLLSHNI